MNIIDTNRRCNLLLHCGSEAVERFEIKNVPTPEQTETWFPLAHQAVLEEVERQFDRHRLRVVNEAHALSKDGLRYFGLFQIATSNEETAFVVGLRNSHDKSFPVGLVGGHQVFVCDNLAFAGEIRIARKHTKNLLSDFPLMTCEAVGRLAGEWADQTRRIATYKAKELTDRHAHDLVVRALDAGVVCAKKVPAVLQEWREPRHDAFRPRTVWSLHNAFTEVLKPRGLESLADNTRRLTVLLDEEVRAAA